MWHCDGYVCVSVHTQPRAVVVKSVHTIITHTAVRAAGRTKHMTGSWERERERERERGREGEREMSQMSVFG